jgi:hypothetical protein
MLGSQGMSGSVVLPLPSDSAILGNCSVARDVGIIGVGGKRGRVERVGLRDRGCYARSLGRRLKSPVQARKRKTS